MEQWNKGNKMIRGIGQKEDPYEYIDMMDARLRGMEELASTHITWYTHKNPYGCWICDMFLLSQKMIDGFREFLGPKLADVEEELIPSKNSLETMQDDMDDSESRTDEEGE